MISGSTWIVWLHLLAAAMWLGGTIVILGAILPVSRDEAGREAAKRALFLTSRAMEAAIVTGVLNVLLRVMASGGAFSRGFVAMLSLKVGLVVVMAALQMWVGIAWKRPVADVATAARRARVSLTVLLVVGAVVLLLGLGVRSV
jgi:putative copper export protein